MITREWNPFKSGLRREPDFIVGWSTSQKRKNLDNLHYRNGLV